MIRPEMSQNEWCSLIGFCWPGIVSKRLMFIDRLLLEYCYVLYMDLFDNGLELKWMMCRMDCSGMTGQWMNGWRDVDNIVREGRELRSVRTLFWCKSRFDSNTWRPSLIDSYRSTRRGCIGRDKENNAANRLTGRWSFYSCANNWLTGRWSFLLVYQ